MFILLYSVLYHKNKLNVQYNAFINKVYSYFKPLTQRLLFEIVAKTKILALCLYVGFKIENSDRYKLNRVIFRHMKCLFCLI